MRDRFKYIILIAALSCFSLAFSSPKPSWTTKAFWEDEKSYYYVGVASNVLTEERGRIEAHEHALAEAIQHLFGIEASMSRRAFIENETIQLDEDISIKASKTRLVGVKVVDQFVEKVIYDDGPRYNVWRAISLEKDLSKQSRIADWHLDQKYSSPIGNETTARGRLVVQTTPLNAKIFLNGESIGNSNATFTNIGVGKYELTIEKPGFDPAKRKLLISSDHATKITLNLTPQLGTVNLTSSPSGAAVYINDEIRGYTPVNIQLQPNRYRLVVGSEDYKSENIELDLQAGAREIKHLTLSPLPGTLSLQSSPIEAVVYNSDGQRLGKTPLFLESFPAGLHDIIFEAKGYPLVKRDIVVNPKKLAVLKHNFGLEDVENPKLRKEDRSAADNSLRIIARFDLPLENPPASMNTDDTSEKVKLIGRRLAREELENAVAESPLRLMKLDNSIEKFWRYVRENAQFSQPTYSTKDDRFYLTTFAEIDLSGIKNRLQ